jgi:hypothetical protein
VLEIEIVDRVVGGSIRGRRSKSEQLDCAVIASRSKVLVRGVESNAFNMALMYRESLQLLECMP